MLERRIAYAKDKTEIIGRLKAGDESTGPFVLIADVLVFAAAFGVKRKQRIRLSDTEEPIRQSVFDRQGYDTMMNLIALHADSRPDSLADSDEAIEARARAFEEYANGGLAILQEELRGALDVLETLVLLINGEREKRTAGTDVFELSKLIS
jgi:dnd system-associated protein 4